MHTVSAILQVVKKKNVNSPVSERFQEKLLTLWPALKGCLAQVRKPCIRPNCQACASGAKHPNYLLAFASTVYVPVKDLGVMEPGEDGPPAHNGLQQAVGHA